MDSVASVPASPQTQRHGRLVQSVFDAFAADPDNAYTTADLAMRAYGVELDGVTRAHRVAMQRAMKRACEIERRLRCENGDGPEGQLIIFDCTSVPSYAMFRLKTDWLYHYQWTRGGYCWPYSEKQLREKLAEPRYQEYIQPGGAWSDHVEYFRAEVTGDTETAARLKAKRDAEMAAWAASMQAAMGKRVAPGANFGQTQQAEPTEQQLIDRIGQLLLRLESMERSSNTFEVWRDEQGAKRWRLEFIDASAAPAGQTQHNAEAA